MLQRDKFYKTVYFGGIEQSLRRDIWPFLLHHYELESTVDERREIDRQMRRIYEEAMTEWCAAHLMLSALLCSALLLVLSFHFISILLPSPRLLSRFLLPLLMCRVCFQRAPVGLFCEYTSLSPPTY